MTAHWFSSPMPFQPKPLFRSELMKRKISVLLLCMLLVCLISACGKTEITDGTYTIEAALSGGSGRASVASPAQLVIAGEQMTATIVWSSPYYEYMIVDGVRYDPIQTEGNSTFALPVELDVDMAVSACTIAMSEPHLVDYTLHFDSRTMKTS